MALVVNDRYAGDEAWQEWFKICSVAGCGAENAVKLLKQVESAMLAQLVRYGFTVEDAAGDDPVAFFDGYFKLKGSRETAKPLKSYFAYRIAADDKRHLEWENAGPEDIAQIEIAAKDDSASTLDADNYRAEFIRLAETAELYLSGRNTENAPVRNRSSRLPEVEVDVDI